MHTIAPERWSARIGARLDQDGYVRIPSAERLNLRAEGFALVHIEQLVQSIENDE